MIKLNVVLIISALLMSACATQPLPLKKEAVNEISLIDQALIIPQNTLDVTVVEGNPGSSGLLGALIVAAIDSARQRSAQSNAQPIIYELRQFDFRSVMLEAMNAEIAKQDALTTKINVALENADSTSARRAVFNHSNADAVLFTKIDYKLQSGDLIVSANAEIYPKAASLHPYREQANSEDPLDKGNVIYRNSFTHVQQAVSAANIKLSLTAAANSIARQIILDIANPL